MGYGPKLKRMTLFLNAVGVVASDMAQSLDFYRLLGLDPWDAFWGQRYAQLRDPDGVRVDLYVTL